MMSKEFVKLMKAKGLLGGDHFPKCSSTMDRVRDDEEVIEKPAGKNLKRRSDNVEEDDSMDKQSRGTEFSVIH